MGNAAGLETFPMKRKRLQAEKPAMEIVCPVMGMNHGFLALQETSVFPRRSGAMESLIARMERMKQAAASVQRSENVNIKTTLLLIRPPAKAQGMHLCIKSHIIQLSVVL